MHRCAQCHMPVPIAVARKREDGEYEHIECPKPLSDRPYVRPKVRRQYDEENPYADDPT